VHTKSRRTLIKRDAILLAAERPEDGGIARSRLEKDGDMLREHSMFFGFAAALVCAVVVGLVSHWSLIWMAATAFAGIFFFPRYFYGFKEARALRDADFELGSGKSVSWYVEPPPNQLIAKAHAEMRGVEAGDEPDDTEWQVLAGENQ
jgi:hypothetical protein